MRTYWRTILAFVVCVVAAAPAAANVFSMPAGLTSLRFVEVGAPGNGDSVDGYGSVDHAYHIGKYEVTAAQYTEFLNAVAADDTYGLYNESMWTSDYGCKIERTGSAGSYAYSITSDRANRPVNFVSWGDAARFANWLDNGQRTGAQDMTTTEDGAYFLNGATADAEILAVTRAANALFYLPSEDEWYKAAYYDPDYKPGMSIYYDYPTNTNVGPSNDVVDPDPGNNANFYAGPGDWTVGSPYWTTRWGSSRTLTVPGARSTRAGTCGSGTKRLSRPLEAYGVGRSATRMAIPASTCFRRIVGAILRRSKTSTSASASPLTFPNRPRWVCWPWAGWRC